jgi:hypothetical protein
VELPIVLIVNLTRPGIVTMICYNRGEYANHYTIDQFTVIYVLEVYLHNSILVSGFILFYRIHAKRNLAERARQKCSIDIPAKFKK